MSYEPVRSKNLPPLPKISQVAMLVDVSNYSQVDMYAQIILRELPEDPHANIAAAWVANHFELYEKRDAHLAIAKSQDALSASRGVEMLCKDLHIELGSLLSEPQSDQSKTHQPRDEMAKRLHLIKAWGFGFGSEMASLMGQAYLAEVTSRTPVVHWGSNFLYREAGSKCVFDHFFEPFNKLSIESQQVRQTSSIFPNKWTHENLLSENINKKSGEFSQLSFLNFLNQSAQLTVSDYYSGVLNIKPWVPTSHPLSHLTLDDTYRYLAKKYLRPRERYKEKAEQFIEQNLASGFIAVHARGSDKDEGYRDLQKIPMQKLAFAKSTLQEYSEDVKLFLMTDDQALLETYQNTFRSRLVTIDVQRAESAVGVHYNSDTNKLLAGEEMLVDMMIAARAKQFIGLGLSNPSQLIYYFGNFSPDTYTLFGENRLKQFNTHLYRTIKVT